MVWKVTPPSPKQPGEHARATARGQPQLADGERRAGHVSPSDARRITSPGRRRCCPTIRLTREDADDEHGQHGEDRADVVRRGDVGLGDRRRRPRRRSTHGAHSARTFCRRTIQMKTGAPTKAVMMPTSISAGPGDHPADDVGGGQQARRRRAPRTAAASGGRRRSSSRHRCGTTRPTNAIGPATAVAAPHRITAPDAPPAAGSRRPARRGRRRRRRRARARSARGPSPGRPTAPTTRNGSTCADPVARRAADAADLPEPEAVHDVDPRAAGSR